MLNYIEHTLELLIMAADFEMAHQMALNVATEKKIQILASQTHKSRMLFSFTK